MSNDITIRIVGKDEFVTAHTFVEATEHVLAMLNGIDRQMLKDDEAPAQWQITRLSMNSPPELTMSGRPGVIGLFLAGAADLEQNPKRPRSFSDPVLRRLKRLVSLLNNGATSIGLRSDGLTVTPTQHAAANVDAIIKMQPKAYKIQSQLEGKLEMLSVHEQQPEFHIYDALTNEPVRCIFNEEFLGNVAELIKTHARVRVSGLTTYNAAHKATCVAVDSYEVLPKQEDLPQIADLHKAQIDITGGIDSAEYIRGLRDESKD